MAAAVAGHTPVVRALLAADAKLETREDRDGVTALMWAAFYGREEATRALLAAGAAVDARDRHGRTALMGATLGGHATTVKALLAAVADAGIRDRDGWTALDYARRQGHGDVVALFRDTPSNHRELRSSGATSDRPSANPLAHQLTTK